MTELNGSLLGQASELLKEAADKIATQRASAAKELQELLLQDGERDRGDAGRLLKLINVLGIDLADVPGLVENLREVKRCEAVLREADERRAALTAAQADRGRLLEWYEKETKAFRAETDRRRAAVDSACSAAEGAVAELGDARHLLEVSRAKWDQLANGPQPDADMGESGGPSGYRFCGPVGHSGGPSDPPADTSPPPLRSTAFQNIAGANLVGGLRR